ncbi:hypothetical protein [Kineococcus rubinsiae]|uniref:hypothetical protein n=1 Tax=Kineococcus rubinsiae TaxID=2609562 RepID=UPI00143078BB|nr:hypothetical protein [Kineococcus rubinsiae]NIZ92909.1 hypothetical protein [Kineococcus rubinsiae]
MDPVDEPHRSDRTGAEDLTRPVPVPPPSVPPRPRTVDVGAVLSGLVLLAVAAGVTAREVTGTTWDWRWSAAGVLLLSGLCVVVAAVVAALGQRHRAGGRRPAGGGAPR